MKIFAILGDCHGDIRGQYKYLLDWQERTGTKIDVALHVGDFGIYGNYQDWPHYWNGNYKVPIPTWVNPGNHEGWVEITKWMNEPDRIENLHLLPDGGITDFDGFKVGSIWGNYSPNSYANPEIVSHVRRHHPSSLKTMHIYKPSVERLKALGAFDMLITHDGPLGLTPSLRQPPKGIKRALGLESTEIVTGCPAFLELYETSKCASHFYGHFHSYAILQEPDVAKHKPLVVCLHCFNFDKEKSVWMMEV